MVNLLRDQNRVTVIGGVSSADSTVVLPSKIDSVTGRLLVDNAGGTGTVTSVSVVSANGLAGTVANATTTPAITLTTSITGVLKGNGTAISAATAGTDYAVGSTGLSGGQTIAGSTLTTENLTLRANAADLTTGQVNITSSKEASNTTTGALAVAGGLAVAKRVYALDMTVTNTITGSISGNAATSTTAPTTAILVDQTSGQTLGTTGARLAKLWSTDITVTNAISGSVTGNAGTVTGFSPTSGKVLSVVKTMSLTAADDTGVYTLPTGTKTLVATDVATLSSLTSHGTITSGGLGTGAVIGGVTMTLGSDASYDMYYRNSSGVLTRIPNGTTGQVLTATTSAAPAFAAAGGGGASTVASSFTGNGGTNTAIAHGLGATPKIVIISRPTAWVGGIQGGDPTEIVRYDSGSVTTVTAMDATNFYVSGAFNTNAVTFYYYATS